VRRGTRYRRRDRISARLLSSTSDESHATLMRVAFSQESINRRTCLETPDDLPPGGSGKINSLPEALFARRRAAGGGART
jgi:hypothetical protein